MAHARGQRVEVARWGVFWELVARVLMFASGVFLGSGLRWGPLWVAVWGFTGLAALGMAASWMAYRQVRGPRVWDSRLARAATVPSGGQVISVRVPAGVAADLLVEADVRGVTLSDVVRDRLATYPAGGGSPRVAIPPVS